MTDPKQAQLEITCHCKAVRITFPPLRKPALECLCSICRRYGALWAYYKPEEVHVEGETVGYSWGRKELSFNRCKECGCMTHYTIVGGEQKPRTVVNCRMLEKKEFKDLDTVESEGE